MHGRVLVVDDNADYRRIVGLRLGHVGLSCRLAGTHAEALRLLAEDSDRDIEVVVVDYHMGTADVALLVRRIRELRPDVTIVGHSSMERREHFAALGVDRFLRKPWKPEQLLAVLRKERRSGAKKEQGRVR
jgi:CheY-like chemotaxis protein